MKKVIRLNEQDIELLVRKIIKKDYKETIKEQAVIEEGLKGWVMGILLSVSTLFSNPAAAQQMSDEEIQTEIVDSWEKFKAKAENEQKDTTDKYLWSIYKDTVAVHFSKCGGCDKDTSYRIEDIIERTKLNRDGTIDADVWKLGTSKESGKDPHAYSKSRGKYKSGEEIGDDTIRFNKVKDNEKSYRKDTKGNWEYEGGNKTKFKK